MERAAIVASLETKASVRVSRGDFVTLVSLDQQLSGARSASEAPALTDRVWSTLATTVHDEVLALGEQVTNQLRIAMFIPPERYVDELKAFQAWMTIADANAGNPAIVRAQVMTELYVAFVWLRDSLMKPIAERMPDDSTFAAVAQIPQRRSTPTAAQRDRARPLVLLARLHRPRVLGGAHPRQATRTPRDPSGRS
jgi:hypothetical protein